MRTLIPLVLINLFACQSAFSQEMIQGNIDQGEIVPLDTTFWDISAQAHVFERYEGKDAIYIQEGFATLKETKFLNGTIEFDVYLTERQAFPGVRFRADDGGNMESFYLRPHLSGKPDGNQAVPVINGISAWQLYFGPAYSFAYEYQFDGWTHVKLVIHDRRAQVYLDYSETPHLSWNLKHAPREGLVAIGGSFAPMHYADFRIDTNSMEIIDFHVVETEPVEGAISEWEISSKFEEALLSNPEKIEGLIDTVHWKGKIRIEENSAANVSWVATRYGTPGNTVFARLRVESDRDQLKLFEFGYSDRVVAIVNGRAIYKGNNKWRTRDYRYLGTIGLFDAIYVPLVKGENTILLAVSEDFGGWGVMGRFENQDGLQLR